MTHDVIDNVWSPFLAALEILLISWDPFKLLIVWNSSVTLVMETISSLHPLIGRGWDSTYLSSSLRGWSTLHKAAWNPTQIFPELQPLLVLRWKPLLPFDLLLLNELLNLLAWVSLLNIIWHPLSIGIDNEAIVVNIDVLWSIVYIRQLLDAINCVNVQNCTFLGVVRFALLLVLARTVGLLRYLVSSWAVENRSRSMKIWWAHKIISNILKLVLRLSVSLPLLSGHLTKILDETSRCVFTKTFILHLLNLLSLLNILLINLLIVASYQYNPALLVVHTVGLITCSIWRLWKLSQRYVGIERLAIFEAISLLSRVIQILSFSISSCYWWVLGGRLGPSILLPSWDLSAAKFESFSVSLVFISRKIIFILLI